MNAPRCDGSDAEGFAYVPRQLSYGSLQLPTRFLLSPLAGFTNLPFRRMIRRLGGVGLCTTDLINARSLLARRYKALELVQTCPEDTPLSIQVFGSEPQYLADAARLLESDFQLDSIDINMGCPVPKVAGHGAGAALMKQSDSAVELVRTVVEAVSLPVTVKMRLGWDDRSLTAPGFARAFEEAGVAAIAIHGRTREQGFGGRVDLEGIRQVVEAVDSIDVVRFVNSGTEAVMSAIRLARAATRRDRGERRRERQRPGRLSRIHVQRLEALRPRRRRAIVGNDHHGLVTTSSVRTIASVNRSA